MRQLGIDEAGRGPVIGPMVIAGVVLDEEGQRSLKEVGVTDSKMLSVKRREALVGTIKEVALSNKILILPPQDIDEALNSANNNLNKFEMINMAMIANLLESQEIILDSPTNSMESFRNQFKIFLKNQDRKIVLEHKADMNYTSVGAASILAKVTRDWEIEKLKMRCGIDFGSGYPSDPKTQSFLKDHFDKYDFFRKSWSSWKKASKSKDAMQSSLEGW